ncbi:amidohydrolase [uncultured Arthrobacter sp.]|uniref:amidohydrolase n=1 Tax=uncultured Arthrobacter sp. TaxID=114050 RepID=UPI00260F5578|nr:amidohydrolase [uncultured Arthrobacter sp.]
MTIDTAVLELSEAHTDAMHELYRHLHAHPELSMQETQTAAFIQNELDGLGLETFVSGGTGVVGVLRNGEGPVVGYRADTDGLPIAEDTGLDFASTAKGKLADGTDVPVMHGCGHDTHMTVGLTAARLLSENLGAWSGTVVFIFQPGEETGAGAKAMVADGLWDRAPKPSVIYGQHVWPGLTGTVSISKGTAMAMADSWKVTVHGKQSHGSQPELSIDPIVLGAHMVVRLQTVVSREVHPMKSAVVTIGTFHGGLKENIIPASAEFTLNVRTFDPEVRELVLGSLRRIISAEAAASGAPEPGIEEITSFPQCYNDPDTTTELMTVLGEVLGDDAVIESPPVMGSEDFGLLAEAIGVPSVYWFFGGHPQELLDGDAPVAGNHSPYFAPAIEPTLTTGVRAAMTALLSRVGTGA